MYQHHYFQLHYIDYQLSSATPVATATSPQQGLDTVNGPVDDII